MLMIDFCCEHKTASAAMADRGWDVITLDVDAKFNPDIVCDIRDYTYTGKRPDLMWFSPPCNEFAREFMPWSATGAVPDMSIYYACLRIIDQAKPRYWIIENVRGAIKYFGKPGKTIAGAYFLWGVFPDIGVPLVHTRKKETMSSSWSEQRAFIPYNLSRSVAIAIESQLELFITEAA